MTANKFCVVSIKLDNRKISTWSTTSPALAKSVVTRMLTRDLFWLILERTFAISSSNHSCVIRIDGAQSTSKSSNVFALRIFSANLKCAIYTSLYKKYFVFCRPTYYKLRMILDAFFLHLAINVEASQHYGCLIGDCLIAWWHVIKCHGFFRKILFQIFFLTVSCIFHFSFSLKIANDSLVIYEHTQSSEITGTLV